MYPLPILLQSPQHYFFQCFRSWYSQNLSIYLFRSLIFIHPPHLYIKYYTICFRSHTLPFIFLWFVLNSLFLLYNIRSCECFGPNAKTNLSRLSPLICHLGEFFLRPRGEKIRLEFQIIFAFQPNNKVRIKLGSKEAGDEFFKLQAQNAQVVRVI